MELSSADAQTLRRPQNLHQSISTPHADNHMVSWVVLSKSYVALDADKLRAKLDEAFPGEFLPQRDQGSFVVDGAVPRAQFLIQSRVAKAAGLFMLQSVPGPYTSFFRLRQVHHGSRGQATGAGATELAVDRSYGQAYDRGRSLSLHRPRRGDTRPRDAAYLVHPTRRIIVAFDEDVRRRLANGEQMP